MALVKSSLFDRLEGSFSKYTFRTRLNRMIELAGKRIPRDPKSEGQLGVRAGYSQLVKAYNAATWAGWGQYDRLAAPGNVSRWNAWILRHISEMKDDPTAYWGFAEDSGAVLHDLAEHELDLDITGAEWIQTGEFLESALSFNGSTDYLNRAYASQLQLPFEASLKISFRFRSDPTGGDTAIVDQVDIGPDFLRGYYVHLIDNGRLWFQVFDNTYPIGDFPCNLQTITTWDDGEWHDVVCLRDKTTDKAYIYVDDVVQRTETDYTTLTSENAHGLHVGRASAGGWYYYPGDLSRLSIKIWVP